MSSVARGAQMILAANSPGLWNRDAGTTVNTPDRSAPDRSAPDRVAALRLREMVDEHFDFVWRYARRLGLAPADADDATQQVFVVAARKLDDIEVGRERAFLCASAIRVVHTARRTFARRREVLEAEPPDIEDPAPSPERALDQRRARDMLDEILDEMVVDLRTVFVLVELEELTTVETADLLGLPRGTVASRLRRAREAFRSAARKRQRYVKGPP